MTAKQFRTKIETLFIRENPTATITGWTMPPRKVTYPTGVIEYCGKFHAIAEGFKPRVMVANGDDTYLMVR